jgi:FixJ family two-component response regulator
MELNSEPIGDFGFRSDLAPAGIRLPVIFITGYGDVPMSVSAMQTGAMP